MNARCRQPGAIPADGLPLAPALPAAGPQPARFPALLNVCRLCLRASVALWLSLAPALPAARPQAQQASVAPMRDAATHEQLATQLRKAEDPLTSSTPAPKTDQTKIWQPTSLLARSDFLSMAGQATLVPKGAVLHVPAQYRSRLTLAKNCKILSWSDFFAANRGWIQTLEVTRAQAEADASFPEETVDRIRKSPLVVIATMQGGPISVLPPKPPPAPAPDANQPAPAAKVRPAVGPDRRALPVSSSGSRSPAAPNTQTSRSVQRQ